MVSDTFPSAHMSPQTVVQRVAQETLIANLRNAHALEKQVIAVLQPQLELLTDYPDLHAALSRHIAETHEQARRLEAALKVCGSSVSLLKDVLLSVMGLGQSSVQGFSSDAVLKAVVADMMTEQLEIATYRTLIVLAERAGKPELCPPLQASLREEQAMAVWFDTNLEHLVGRFVDIEAARGRQPDQSGQDSFALPDGAVMRSDTGDAAAARPLPVAKLAPKPTSPQTTGAPSHAATGQPPASGKGLSDV